MRYTDLIFDLYGTLVDIHTDENDLVWDKTALYMRYYGASYDGPGLREAFSAAMTRREAQAGQSYECFPDIPFEQVMAELLRADGVTKDAERLGVNAAQVFRICATDYIRLYAGVKEALAHFRKLGLRLWLLSNAQQVFTAYELRSLGLGDQLDGILLSSDYGCRKPDPRFFGALLSENGLQPERCLMIGNDRQTDIAGARRCGIDTLYMHTALTPDDQLPADPALHPDHACDACRHFEYEGDDWHDLSQVLTRLALQRGYTVC